MSKENMKRREEVRVEEKEERGRRKREGEGENRKKQHTPPKSLLFTGISILNPCR
jgi:hypothetical protein